MFQKKDGTTLLLTEAKPRGLNYRAALDGRYAGAYETVG